MQLVIFEKGFNYSQDGVGNRLVYYLQGCNMNCPWCANPEGIPISPPILVDGKFLLDSVCPHGAIKNQALDRRICIACDRRECLNLYKNKGIGCKGKAIEVDAIVLEACECVPMFFDNGGVTLTGGEPTLQFDAVGDLLVKLHAAGIHTAMETNGTCPGLPALFPLIDQLMMDFKHYDSAVLRAVTGVGNETTMDNLRKATVAHKAVNIRIPLIHGFNTSEDNLFGTAAFLQTLDTECFSVEFLRYHEYGKGKWNQCGLPYGMDGSACVDSETLDRFQTVFRASGFCVINT